MFATTDTGFITRSIEVNASPAPTGNGIFPNYYRLLGGLLFLALSGTLVAQTHFCIGGDLDHLAPASIATCQAKMSGVRDAAKRQGVPANWHFVVVCDEAGWKEYTSFSSHEDGLLAGAGYSTDPRLRWTFLRGSQLDTDQPQAAATMVSMAIENVPNQKSAPRLAPSVKAARPLSIAMAGSGSSTSVSQ
jgi:hypothetical protein